MGTRNCWGCGFPDWEGAKFWLSVLTEIHNRGVKDILIACVDGLTGFPIAIETVFPKTQIQCQWANIIPFFAFLPEIRRAIYTTNAIESMNSSLRKVIKSQQIFPSDDDAFMLVYLAIRNIS
jgi:transposase-like protein